MSLCSHLGVQDEKSMALLGLLLNSRSQYPWPYLRLMHCLLFHQLLEWPTIPYPGSSDQQLPRASSTFNSFHGKKHRSFDSIHNSQVMIHVLIVWERISTDHKSDYANLRFFMSSFWDILLLYFVLLPVIPHLPVPDYFRRAVC